MANTGILEGQRRRDAALSVVSANRSAEIWQAQLAMLTAMRERETRTGTADDVTPSGMEYSDSAPWLGAAVRQLAQSKLIARAGTVISTRPSRKGNETKLWKLADDARADAAIANLRRLVAAIAPSPPAPATSSLFDETPRTRYA